MTPKSKRPSSRGASPSVSQAARALLRERLYAVRDALKPAARWWRESPEPVHRLRVAARRGVAAIDLLEPLLPRRKARRMRKLLQEVRRACDAARNGDVLLIRVDRHGGPQRHPHLIGRIKTQRRKDQQAIADIHRRLGTAGALARKSKKLLAKVRWGRRGATGGEPTFPRFIHQQLREPIARFSRALRAKPSSGKALHRLRIRGKRLRYSLELAGDAVPRKPRERCLAMLRQLQDHLGEINDSRMVCAAIRRHAKLNRNARHALRIETLLAKEEAAQKVARRAFAGWRNAVVFRTSWLDNRRSKRH